MFFFPAQLVLNWQTFCFLFCWQAIQLQSVANMLCAEQIIHPLHIRVRRSNSGMYDPEDTPNLSFCNAFLLVPVFLWKEKSYKVEASASRGPVGCATRGDEGLQLPSAISKPFARMRVKADGRGS